MHGMVKSFLDAQKERENKERQELLIELGFFEKEYSPNNVYCEAYPFAEWNAEQKCQNFYKKVAIEMSEEEFQDVMKYFKQVKPTPKNGVASLLTAIAVITFVLGGISGLVLAQQSIGLLLMTWYATFVGGVLLIGFSQVIKLLHEILKK